MKRLIRVNRPKRVGDEIQYGENENQSESAEFGLVADGDEDYERATDEVEQDVKEVKVHSDQSEEHDDEENTPDELEVVLGVVVAESGHAGE